MPNFIKRNGLARRKRTHASQKLIDFFTKEGRGYLSLIKTFHDSKEELIYINFDEVHVPYDLSSDYSLHFAGEKDVDVITPGDNKAGTTLMPCNASSGECFPPLIIFPYSYAEKSNRKFPKKFERFMNLTSPYMIRFSSTGFNKEFILQEYIEKIILPWQLRKGKQIVLLVDQAGCHTSIAFKNFLDKQRLFYLFLPAGCTHIFQPLDVTINRPLKAEIRKFYLSWLEKQVARTNVYKIAAPTEEIILDWMYKSTQTITSTLILQSFQATGILGTLETLYSEEGLNWRIKLFS